jgi:DNA-binding MarR family transcriptional regulator
VIQDPVWEQSFPDVSGIVVPLRDPRSGRITHVRLTKKERLRRRRANEEQPLALLEKADPARPRSRAALVERALDVLGASRLERVRRARRGGGVA